MYPALLIAPLLLAAVLALAAAAKWRRTESLVSATRLLKLPAVLERPVRLLPAVEAVLAVGLVASPWTPLFVAVSAATLGLMAAYLAVIARGLTLTPRPSCGCFGDVGAPISVGTLTRNTVLTLTAAAGLAWALAGNTVPGALLGSDAGTWAWLVAAAVVAAVTRWIVRERMDAPAPAPIAAATVQTGAEASGRHTDDADAEEYERSPIPPLMLLRDGRPVTLTSLARRQAHLLIWVTCGCGRNKDAIALADRWRDSMPQIAVRPVSTLSPEETARIFPGERPWLYDPDQQGFIALGLSQDPAALLLGADGLVAGGPVWGTVEVEAFGEQIAAQLAEADLPTPDAVTAG